jgi:uncharacterized protein YjlB
MPLLEDLKKTTEKLTGWQRPTPMQLAHLPRRSKANVYRFRDDGLIPNHPLWPVIIYRRAVRFPRRIDPAAVMEDIFDRNGWGDSWRDGIYDYLHYHSRTHEVLGVARGTAQVRLGGDKGRTFKIAAGDVVILPAGTGHQSLKASGSLSSAHIRPKAPMTNASRIPRSIGATSGACARCRRRTAIPFSAPRVSS